MPVNEVSDAVSSEQAILYDKIQSAKAVNVQEMTLEKHTRMVTEEFDKVQAAIYMSRSIAIRAWCPSVIFN
jgi:chaperonin cofactor prefoldin